MKSTQRHAAAAVGFLGALADGSARVRAAAPAPAQRGGPPNQDTPYILVATFQSADRKLGVEAADELRKRIQGEHSAKELYAMPKDNINGTLRPRAIVPIRR